MTEAWRLVVFAVPDRLGGLLSRLGFQQTKKNPANWWRLYRVEQRSSAEMARQQLRQAGLQGRWTKVELQVRQSRGPSQVDFAKHHTASGAWRMKRRRRG